MNSRLTILLLLLAVLALIIRENMTTRPEDIHQTAAGEIEMCLSCHQTEVLDPAHDRNIMGCSPCHSGDRLAIDKDLAHTGLIKNPGDLRVVDKTCGMAGCHAPDVKKVKNSLMATNRGILATLLYYWGEAPDQDGNYSVEQLLTSGNNSLALDYYRKMCATCHLWKQKGDLPGFFGEKGGGCTACHYQEVPGKTMDNKKKHPLISKNVASDNCIRCHNRSGRIGISYTGVYESENYGTPFQKGKMSENRLPGDRFYLELAPDIHYQKGMACIDCHTRNEIMGDGQAYSHYEEQLEIECTSCHLQATKTAKDMGLTRKGNRMDHLIQNEDDWILVSKKDNKKHKLKPPKSGVCDFAGHQRVGCEACHSPWVPQCYGCHVKRDMSETHLDKLTMKETPGWWDEGRSYIRYEKPMLALWQEEVVIVTPGCQDVVTLLDDQGQNEGSFNRLTMAAINPHTTQPQGRTCQECHTDPKVLGLGEGTLWQDQGKWHFDPVSRGEITNSGPTPPLDAFVTLDGVALQHSSRPDLRPFNREELSRILRIGLCLDCHKDYNDKAWQNYKPNTTCPQKGETGP